MKLYWQHNARHDRERIYAHIEGEAPDAALRMDMLFDEAARGLIDFPDQGRKGRKNGTRELVVHPSYLLIYRIKFETIEILAILHAAQRWP